MIVGIGWFAAAGSGKGNITECDSDSLSDEREVEEKQE